MTAPRDEDAVRVTNLIVRFGNANANANAVLANMQPAQKEKIMAMTSFQERPSSPHQVRRDDAVHAGSERGGAMCCLVLVPFRI